MASTLTEKYMADVNETHCTCMRLAKALVAETRKLGTLLDATWEMMPAGTSQTKWERRIQKKFGIPAEIATTVADFSLLPQVIAAKVSPAEACTFGEALRVLEPLISGTIDEEQCDVETVTPE